MTTWTGPEVGTFLAAISEHRLLPLFTLAFSTGLRRGEICGLEWGDLSADKSRMRIQWSVVSVDYELVEHLPKTRSGMRQVGLDSRRVDPVEEATIHRTSGCWASVVGDWAHIQVASDRI